MFKNYEFQTISIVRGHKGPDKLSWVAFRPNDHGLNRWSNKQFSTQFLDCLYTDVPVDPTTQYTTTLDEKTRVERTLLIFDYY